MHSPILRSTKRVSRLMALASMLTLVLGTSIFGNPTSAQAAQDANKDCNLANGVKHVIHIQFDNVHFRRDNPNVPSDLEQMPTLLNFMKQNGTMLTDHHTPLIAHTATDILTTLTGVYGDRHGMPISNSYRYFNPNGTTNPASSFAYWTDPVYDFTNPAGGPTDTSYNMITKGGKNTPAPWVPYTRAGCNFGAISSANTILENIGTDIPTVFGANSPEQAEAKADPNQATADFVGLGVHCAKNNTLCANGQQDRLPDEPGGYTGYKALFGNKYMAPAVSNGPITNLDGKVIASDKGNVGFPGFDGMSASNSLAYVAQMQEHHVPVTYAYISDAHDNHAGQGAYGPGQAGYVSALKSYDDAFSKFFTRLSKDGINRNNALFVFTSDENDHFVGGAPNPANCNGLTIPCTYDKIGEINLNVTGLLAQQGVTTPFKVHADSAPNFYIDGNPARTSATARNLERAVGNLQVTNPLSNKTEKITNYLADPVESKLLHIQAADAARNPNFTLFAKPDYYVNTGAPNCTAACVTEPPAFAWNHGDVSPDINVTWLGLVGPGIQHKGVVNNVWTDHTDIRPTELALLGLKDDYIQDGRVILEVTNEKALSPALRKNRVELLLLGALYKQINAPVGQLGLDSLKVSTKALESNTANDKTYNDLEGKLTKITDQRDALAGKIRQSLYNAEFGTKSVDQKQAVSLIKDATVLLLQVHALSK